MRTVIKAIVVSLGLMAVHGTASADDEMSHVQNRALYPSIAVQGNQALLDIRASVVASIPKAMNQQMAASLPQPAEAGKWVGVRLGGHATDHTVLVMGH